MDISIPTSPGAGHLYALRSVHGGSGRSVIAANLAFELASTGRRTVLMDLDNVWPSLHRYFNLPKQQASVVAALRLLSQGKLDANALEELTVRLVARGISVDFMSGYGLSEASTAPQLETLVDLLAYLRRRFDCVVLDCGPGLATDFLLTVQKAAPINIWVTQVDSVSLGRFVDSQPQIQSTSHSPTQDLLVLNRMRASVLGARPEWQVQQLLRDRTNFARAVIIPDDELMDQALLKGLPLRQLGGKSKALAGIGELAARLQ